MASFAYSFCIALLHSVWQAALLAVGYSIFIGLHKKLSTQASRNLLLLLISTQTLLFIFTLVGSYFNYNEVQSFLINITPYFPQPQNATTLYQWAFALYISIFFIKMVKAIYYWQLFKKELTNSYVKADIDIRLFAAAKTLHLGIKKKVQVWYSHKINTPVTFGFLKPIILLPFSLVNQLTIQQTEAIILHELAHIKANDYLSNWFITVVETFFFFNPFIITLCKKIRLQREIQCDTIVLQYNYSPIVYAEALLVAAKYQQAKLNFSLAAVSSKKELLHRIQYFTSIVNTQKNKNPFGLLLVFVIGLLLFLSVTTIGIKHQQPSAKEILSLPLLGVEADWLGSSTNFVETKPAFITKPILTTKKSTTVKKINSPTIAVIKIEPETVEYKLVNVANKESVENSQQIIIEEEQSGNKPALMMIYKATNINGEWVLEPQMIITKTVQDSIKQNRDSTLPELKIEQ
ncbi:MAG: M56 family metallopeptidase [Ferruginibacter sp.]|nr:M56 family metallopeptidase [Ferruginibacter sp.]